MSDQEFPKSYEKKLPTGFQEMAASMSTEELKAKIYESQAHIYEIDRAKDEDAKLNEAKEQVKEFSGPYREAAACENAKVKFCFFTLEGRGINITPKS